MLFIAGEEALLHVEGDVTEAIGCAVVAIEKRRQVDEDFRMSFGNEFETLAIVVVPDFLGLGVIAVDEVGAELLLQTRRDGDERGDPVGLLALGFSDAFWTTGCWASTGRAVANGTSAMAKRARMRRLDVWKVSDAGIMIRFYTNPSNESVMFRAKTILRMSGGWAWRMWMCF
jgi:hypothetical protein